MALKNVFHMLNETLLLLLLQCNLVVLMCTDKNLLMFFTSDTPTQTLISTTKLALKHDAAMYSL